MQKEHNTLMRQMRTLVKRMLRHAQSETGKMTISVIVGAAVLLAFAPFSPISVFTLVRASTVQTAVTVLNTPPNWTVDAEEEWPSATSTPTNVGTQIRWVATATDSSGDNYWLLICKTSGAPTPVNNGSPLCAGGIGNIWAMSPTTTSGVAAYAATTTVDGFPFNNEKNEWYAFICDGNPMGAQCQSVVSQGFTDPTRASPFVVNHPPSFTAISNNSPQDPGGSLTWTATASDSDVIRGGDSQMLYVCKTQSFSTSTGCLGGTWAVSAFASTSPAATTVLGIPMQDGTWNAYVYIVDNAGLEATTTPAVQSSNSSFVVNEMAPTVTASGISLINAGTSTRLTLTVPNGQTTGFKVAFTVNDNNGCQNLSGTNEITSATAVAYRSGVGSSCAVDSNNCYYIPAGSCVQDTPQACTPSISSMTWTCTFSMWYNADPTDANSKFPLENWLASVRAVDDHSTASATTTALTGTILDGLMAFAVPETTIAYGGLQPGQSGPVGTTTTMISQGNVGMDEGLYGDTMCVGWSGADSCDVGGPNNATKIPVGNQKFASSSVAYASAFAYQLTGSTSPSTLAIHVPKVTATSSPTSRPTYWGIQIPGTISQSGNYSGQNTIMAILSNPSYW